ncbi:MAG: hemerythrin domain-containing protein [Pseudomonadota bacterium]
MHLQNYQEQHREILSLCKEIMTTAPALDARQDAEIVAAAINQLTGVVALHLSMEDKHLYPNLMAADDRDVSQTAARFQMEMGNLADIFRAFVQRYRTAELVQNNAASFVDELTQVTQALQERIEREETELYPLTRQDKIHPGHDEP